jgi:quercetin dioxygenase-like cupin family protein
MNEVIDMKTARITTAGVATLAGVVVLQLASAQQLGIQRSEVLRNDLSVPGREVIQVLVDFAAGASFPRHSHPGEEVAYVIEGKLEYRLDGQPPVILEAGDALFIPAGVVHAVTNLGVGNGSELATYIVENGEPLVVLAP